MNKNVLGVIGVLLIALPIVGGNLKYLTDWSTAELVGYNFSSLISIFGGGFLVYLGIKK